MNKLEFDYMNGRGQEVVGRVGGLVRGHVVVTINDEGEAAGALLTPDVALELAAWLVQAAESARRVGHTEGGT